LKQHRPWRLVWKKANRVIRVQETKGYGILGRPPLPIFRQTVPSIQNERGDIN
jgi:hypothetical protein